MTRSLRTRAPILHLPNELPVKIFTETLAPNHGDSKRYWHRIIRLSLVSKHWNGIIHGTPSLWAQISSAYSVRENRAVILKSKDCPLLVYYSDGDLYGWDRVVFFDFVSQLAYRWRSAEFRPDSRGTISLLHSFVSVLVPNLEELKVGCSELREHPSMEEMINIFDGRADRLRHIDLRDFPLPWDSGILSRLETLKISRSRSWFGPSTSEITDILRRCPKLRTFGLHYSEPHVVGAVPSEAEAVYLPALTSFSLNLSHASAFRQIISSVRIPACIDFRLVCGRLTSSIFPNEADHLTAA
ncbi:hypothetical protein FRB94_002633, partial [Tulasnella sp. JGI-2019a]